MQLLSNILLNTEDTEKAQSHKAYTLIKDLEKQIPHYRKVYETLRKHIDEGMYKENDILPSENELCAIHKVTRPTVRKALDMLTNEGYIKKHQGLGSVVQNKPEAIGILSISGTTSAIGHDNLKTQVLVKPSVNPWPDDFEFDITETERESGCIYFERLRLVNDDPVFVDITYLPNINLPRFTSRNLENTSLFGVLRENYSLEITGGEQYFEATKANEQIQQQLKIKKNDSILILKRRIETNRIGMHLYSFLYCNTAKHNLYGRF